MPDSQLWKQIVELFEQASLQPAPLAWLTDQCGTDEPLFNEVASLLKARQAEQTAATHPAPDLPARRYGPWELVRRIGAGGMGAVFEVRRTDEEFQQRAALKLVASHLAGPYFLERFRIERQILAQLQHPNIARLLDGGAAGGEPFLVMEYVEGLPLDQYADQHKLTLRQRLALFLRICDAVEYAHRNLIVHRDLKPANILVTTESGEPKLLDFGTARFLSSTPGPASTTDRLITPRYASPEALRQLPITTQTDVFSLGVLLYEQVSGTWPFGRHSTPAETIERITSAEMTAPEDHITREVAAARSTSVGELKNTVRGDLSKILRKATEADVTLRYSSVAALSADIRAFLEGRPVSAQPPTPLYRLSRFVRRNRTPVALAVTAAFVLASLGAYALYQARLASERYAELRSVTSTLLIDLNRAIQEIPGSTESQRILVSRVVPVMDRLAGQKITEPSLQMDLAEAYRQFGDLLGNPYSQNLGDSKGAIAMLQKAIQTANFAVDASPNNVDHLRTRALAEQSLAETLFGTRAGAASLPYARAAIASWDRILQLLGPLATADDLAAAASPRGVYGDALGQPGTPSERHLTEAENAYRSALALIQAALKRDPLHPRSRRAVNMFTMKLGNLLMYPSPELAAPMFAQALANVDHKEYRMRAMLERKLGECESGQGRPDTAINHYLAALALDADLRKADPLDMRADLDTVISQKGLADIYWRSGQYAQAIPLLEASNLILRNLDGKSKDPNQDVRVALADNACKLSSAYGAAPATRSKAEAAAVQCRAAFDAMLRDPRQATPHVLQLVAQTYLYLEPPRYRDATQAVAASRRYIEAAGDEQWGLLNLAKTLQAAGNRQEAAQVAAQALRVIPATSLHLRQQAQAIASRP